MNVPSYTPPLKPSPDNTVITAASAGAITDASGIVWSIVNGQVAVNGTRTANPSMSSSWPTRKG